MTSIIGSTLITRLQNAVTVATALHSVASKVVSKPSRCVTAATTTLAGLGNLWAWQFTSGAVLTAAGVKELHNIFANPSVSSMEKYQVLLSNVSASIDIMASMQEDTKLSLKQMEEKIAVIHKDLKEKEKVLKEINTLAINGYETLEEQKIKAKNLWTEAQSLFKKSLAEFEQSKKLQTEGNLLLADAKYAAECLKTTNPNDTEVLVAYVKSIEKTAIEARIAFKKASQAFDRGLDLNAKAFDKQNEAQEVSIEAIRIAQAKFVEIGDKSKSTKGCEDAIQSLTKTLHATQEQIKEQSIITENMARDHAEARELAEGGFGNQSMIFGVATAAVSGSIPLGIVATKLYHMRKMLSNKIHEFLFGKTELAPSVYVSGFISYAFDSCSSGWKKFVKSGQSWTNGELRILVGDKFMNIRFCLNDRSMIADRDVKNLIGEMNKALDKKLMTPTECLDLMKDLENTIISRGSSKNSMIGFMRKDYKKPGVKVDPYFGSLRRRCADLLLSRR